MADAGAAGDTSEIIIFWGKDPEATLFYIQIQFT